MEVAANLEAALAMAGAAIKLPPRQQQQEGETSLNFAGISTALEDKTVRISRCYETNGP